MERHGIAFVSMGETLGVGFLWSVARPAKESAGWKALQDSVAGAVWIDGVYCDGSESSAAGSWSRGCWLVS